MMNSENKSWLRKKISDLQGQQAEIRTKEKEIEDRNAAIFTDVLTTIVNIVKEEGRIVYPGVNLEESESLQLMCDENADFVDIKELRYDKNEDRGPVAEGVKDLGENVVISLYDQCLLNFGSANAMSLIAFIDKYAS